MPQLSSDIKSNPLGTTAPIAHEPSQEDAFPVASESSTKAASSSSGEFDKDNHKNTNIRNNKSSGAAGDGDISPAQRAEREQQASRQVVFHPMILCPLQNLGNTCYFNAGVQLLVNCPGFVYGLRDSPFMQPGVETTAMRLSHSGGESCYRLYRAFAQLLHTMEYAKLNASDALSPVQALDRLAVVYPAFEGRNQQDCTEMVNAVLSTAADEGNVEVDLHALLLSLERDAVAYHCDPKRIDSCGTGAHTGNCRSGGHRPAEDPRLADQDQQDALPTAEGAPPQRRQLIGVSLPGKRSQHIFSLLRLMQQVNTANEMLERKVKQRKNQIYNNSFRPPKLFYNAVTDGFTGYVLSEVRCHSCGDVSRVVQGMNSLILDIPTKAQRASYARRHPEVHRLGPNGEPLHAKKKSVYCAWNPLSIVSGASSWLAGAFDSFGDVGYPLTLEECLDIHFEPVELKGSNKYACESCGRSSTATRTETLLTLPEYLLVHMKRFKSGQLFNSKKSDPVIFPASWRSLTAEEARQPHLAGSRPEILDLRYYMNAAMQDSLADVPTNLRNARTAALPTHGHTGHVVTTYTLDGVVNHHGSIGGGHYTAFAHKVTRNKDMWVNISDEDVAEATVSEVADSEEYLLLYRKQPLVEMRSRQRTLRDKARYYLTEANKADRAQEQQEQPPRSAKQLYISRMWLQRMAFFEDPGPILNELCYCTEEKQHQVTKYFSLFPSSVRVPQDVPHAHGPPVQWYYVPIDQVDYDAFFEMYGGNAAVTEEQYQTMQRDQLRFLREVSQRQRQ